ncbi:MAG TPA: hypothetical protein VN108_01165 [Marmoricola sp.]|nr:hypothetical protein [Marmoricola sp.]
MTIGSITPTAIDALIAKLAGNGFQVIDGPGATDDSLQSALFVGLNSTDSTDFIESAALDQGWAWLGHNMRDENVSVHCLAQAWNGDGDMKAARDAAFATLTAVGALIQADPSLGLLAVPVEGINLLQVSEIRAASFKETQDEEGAIAQLSFDIQVRGRVS